MCLSDTVCDLLLYKLRCKHPESSRGGGVWPEEATQDSVVFGGLQASQANTFPILMASNGCIFPTPLASFTDRAKGNLWHVHHTPTQAAVSDAMGKRFWEREARFPVGDGLRSEVRNIFMMMSMLFLV